jgi:hypothetical protein
VSLGLNLATSRQIDASAIMLHGGAAQRTERDPPTLAGFLGPRKPIHHESRIRGENEPVSGSFSWTSRAGRADSASQTFSEKWRAHPFENFPRGRDCPLLRRFDSEHAFPEGRGAAH